VADGDTSVRVCGSGWNPRPYGRGWWELFRIASTFLAIPLTGQRLFGTLLLARLQIEGVTLNLLNDVFLLHLALETAQCAFERLSILYMNFCQKELHLPFETSG